MAFVNSLFFLYNMVKLVVTKILSPFVIFYLIWFYVHKENCVSASYGMLADVYYTFQICSNLDWLEIPFISRQRAAQDIIISLPQNKQIAEEEGFVRAAIRCHC